MVPFGKYISSRLDEFFSTQVQLFLFHLFLKGITDWMGYVYSKWRCIFCQLHTIFTSFASMIFYFSSQQEGTNEVFLVRYAWFVMYSRYCFVYVSFFFWVNWIQCTLFPMRHQRQFNVDKIDHLFDSIFYFCFCFRCALFAVYSLHSVERHPCLLFSVRTQLNYIMILSPVDPYKIFQVSCKAFFRRPWVCFMVIKVWILIVYILLLPLSKYDSTSKETSANQSFGSGFMRFLFFKSFVVWHILAI